MRVIRFVNPAAYVFAESELVASRLSDPIVQLSSFRPQTELTSLDVTLDALCSRADAGEFVIMNRARAIDRDVGDESAFQQVDDVAIDARSQNMRAHHQDSRRRTSDVLDDGIFDAFEERMRLATVARSGCSNGGAAS